MMKNKNILEDLMTFYVSLPYGHDKMELHNLIDQMTSGRISLKTALQIINNKIQYQKLPVNKDVTLRENKIKVWEYVLNLFTTHLKGV